MTHITVYKIKTTGGHYRLGVITEWGSLWSGGHYGVGVIMEWGSLWSRGHYGVGVIMVVCDLTSLFIKVTSIFDPRVTLCSRGGFDDLAHPPLEHDVVYQSHDKVK